MSGVANTLVIDRLVLDGLDLRQERAEGLRTQVEAELARLLSGQQLIDASIPLVNAPELSGLDMRSDRAVTRGLSSSIAATCTAHSDRNTAK